MSSARFEDGKVADGTAQTADMTARIDLGTFMGLPREKLRECLVKRRVDEMKIFCRNSGLKVPACKKRELVDIILNYRDMGLIKPAGPSLANPTVPSLACSSSAGESAKAKLSGLPQYEKVTDGWSKSTNLLPDFTFMHLYTYLTESKNKTFDLESIKAFKSLKAYKYFAANYIQDTSLYYFGSEEKVLYIRARVSASMKADTYPVYVTMDQQTGEVFGGKCTCVAG